jgi:hypothetical protein
MDAIVTSEDFTRLYLTLKKEHRPKLAQVAKERAVRDMLPEREYLVAEDLFDLGLVEGSDFMLKWLEWGIAPKFTSVKPIMAIYKRSEVVELLQFIELKKKIDQQVVDEKIEDQI